MRADGENWLLLDEHVRHTPAVIVPVSSTSIAESGEMGLADTATFICAGGAIVVNQVIGLVTVYARKKKWGQIAGVEIGRLGDEKVKLWYDIGDEFATGDRAVEKTARLHFGHVLFVTALRSRKGLRFVVKTGKWGRATLTPERLEDFTKVWRRWDGRYLRGDYSQSEGKQFDEKSVEIDEGDTQSSSTTLNADDIEDEKSIWWLDDEDEKSTWETVRKINVCGGVLGGNWNPIKVKVTQEVERSYR